MFAEHAGADLAGQSLAGKDFRWADLSGADLSGADLSGADLRGADLTGADLTGADLTGARLHGALTRPASSANTAGYAAQSWCEAAEMQPIWRRTRRALQALLSRPEQADEDTVLDLQDDITLHAPGWGWPLLQLGRALAERPHLALDLLIAAVVQEPGVAARHALARQFLDQGSWDQAISALARLVEEAPNSGPIHADLGYALGRQGQLEAARSHLELAVALGTRGPNTLAALGMTRHGLGDGEGALAAFRAAVEAPGSGAEHRLNLSRLLELHGNPVAALEAVYDETGPLDASLVYRSAELLAGLGDNAAAERLVGQLPPPPGVPAQQVHSVQAALPLTPAELRAAGKAMPGLGPFVEHLVFAPPVAMVHLLPRRGGVAALHRLRGPTPDSGMLSATLWAQALPPLSALSPASSRQAFCGYARATAPPEPDLPSIQEGGWSASLLALAEVPAPLAAGLRDLRLDLGPDSETVIDGLTPDAAFQDEQGGLHWLVPPTAQMTAPAGWRQAQELALLHLDRAAFLEQGALRLTVGVEADERLRTLVRLVWLRSYLGLATLWPSRRLALLGRARAVLASFSGSA